ncbi:hypothetical protein FRC17_005266 [Serendipita sp. 399]|nr:hypothetical protein FRC17_005266 [Serendipita sp. 399]
MTQFQFEGLLPNQTGLTKLEKLTILLHAQRPTFNEGALLAIVDNLARKSRLKTLGFTTRNARPPVLSAQKLIAHVIQTHNESLEKLKLPLFTVSKVAMIQLLRGLPRLTHLWMAVTESSRGWIPDVLGVSQSLERLRLYGAGNWIINYARSLLLQTTQNLSKIKACRSCWEYDQELKCAVRRVYGPVAIEITTVGDPWGVKRRNRERNNVPLGGAMHVDESA